MSSWHSYPSIYNFGHKAIIDILQRDVLVEEKVDGSQFSFGVFEDGLRVRSKGAVMHPDAPEKMFTKAVESVKERLPLLNLGWTYRGEYLAKPKHNALAYDRTPQGHIILFDINVGEESYLDYEAKAKEAARIGLECVPCLFTGRINTLEEFRGFLDCTSVLGGQRIEGVVVKPAAYDLYGTDKKVLFGKFVSEAFKEVHSNNWKKENPTGKDILGLIGDRYNTPARWNKAIQHLREAGQITDSPQDIGPLIKEIPHDVLKECEQEIRDELFTWAWPHIRRIIVRGFPEYYKEQLLKLAFEAPQSIENKGLEVLDITANG